MGYSKFLYNLCCGSFRWILKWAQTLVSSPGSLTFHLLRHLRSNFKVAAPFIICYSHTVHWVPSHISYLFESSFPLTGKGISLWFLICISWWCWALSYTHWLYVCKSHLEKYIQVLYSILSKCSFAHFSVGLLICCTCLVEFLVYWLSKYMVCRCFLPFLVVSSSVSLQSSTFNQMPSFFTEHCLSFRNFPLKHLSEVRLALGFSFISHPNEYSELIFFRMD